MIKSNPFRKLEEAWEKTEKGVKLKYPIFHHDPNIPDDPIIKRTIEEVIVDIDFWGWEGNKNDRIVDSTGKVFIAKFEKKNGHTLFIIPTEFQSGVFPDEVERTMDIEEIKGLMISGIERNAIRIKGDKDNLKKEISSMNSIEEILNTYAKYF
ncbi:hypothetical protein F7018_11560 [Tenacibaculum aiptasiae]|uniref:Uncharacterized protein n=1 Tax=Tenacibaculum aiptasiae TaxID=426481 RepID=A0A7J5AG17_9FLAO|nr:hypothetical protein [Tenacibaculum aiptasiae]KAB1155939.1 hypothetical protein F7018_11560 [Tenacibaculum aiptasiae]